MTIDDHWLEFVFVPCMVFRVHVLDILGLHNDAVVYELLM